MGLTIGIDIGGTFTDVAGYDWKSGQLYFTKVPSTPPTLSEGFIQGIEKVLRLSGRVPNDLNRLIHGTTVSLNAILEHKGAVLGMLTTKGFEDVLTIGRQKRTAMYDLFMDPETPMFLCPPRRVYGITERLSGDGSIATPLNEVEIRAAVTDLVERHRVQCIVVFYLLSFLNPAHEQRTAEIVRGMYPAIKVTLSSVVDPHFGEYDRLCVTAFDAYVKPVVETYIQELEQRLIASGIDCKLQIMQSRGGITNTRTIVERPVTTIMSGPAAAVIAGRALGEQIGQPDLITVDIGGTSCDIALVSGNKPLISVEGKVGNYPLRVPMIDVNSIGAGGGSIAWIDPAGGLRVGPQSAGSRPGPACYGGGGVEATVTDASLVLGYLNPDYFGCDEITLDPALAEQAVARLAAKIGLDVSATALGIHRIVNAKMADEMRLVSIKRGYDPREFALVAAGGGGGVHAGRLAEHLNIPTAIMPPAPGCLSALGLLIADIEHEQGVTHRVAADAVDLRAMSAALDQLARVCAAKMQGDNVDPSGIQSSRFAGMRYVGQSYELEVEFPEGELSPALAAGVVAEFHRVHDRVYNHSSPDSPVEFVSLRVVQRFSLPSPKMEIGQRDGSLADALKGRRRALFDSAVGYVDVPVYDRYRLPLGQKLTGPAIIEQEDTTSVIYPDHHLSVDRFGNVIIQVPIDPRAQRSKEARIAAAG